MELFDILLANGHIIDPSQKINKVSQIGIKNGLISKIEDGLKAHAKRTYDLTGMIVTPGLIDIHCHPSQGFSHIGVNEDDIGLHSGVTLLCDAGSSGAYNFQAFKELIIESSKTKILCFLNVANTGLVKMPEITNQNDMDLKSAEIAARENTNLIKGFKLRLIESFLETYGLRGVEEIKKVTLKTDLPLMVHIGQTRPRVANDKMDLFTRQAVDMLDRGDIISHFLTWEPGGLIKPDGEIYPELLSAQKRGVVLDASHGLNHFSLSVAKHAIANKIVPTVLSTDLCDIVIPSAQSLTVVMSKFLNLGIPIEDLIAQTTVNPSRAIDEENVRGSLRVGSAANITVMEVRKGRFLFTDGNGKEKMEGDKIIEPRFVIQGDKIIPAFSNYHIAPDFN
jgi:dihydroorotase